jgi:hypothetical protein
MRNSWKSLRGGWNVASEGAWLEEAKTVEHRVAEPLSDSLITTTSRLHATAYCLASRHLCKGVVPNGVSQVE